MGAGVILHQNVPPFLFVGASRFKLLHGEPQHFQFAIKAIPYRRRTVVDQIGSYIDPVADQALSPVRFFRHR